MSSHTVYCTRNSRYFFSKGDLYWIQDQQRKGVFPAPSYNQPTDVIELAKKHKVNFKKPTEIGKLEAFLQELKEKRKPHEETGGIFVSAQTNNGTTGRAVHTGIIVEISQLSREELVPYLRPTE